MTTPSVIWTLNAHRESSFQLLSDIVMQTFTPTTSSTMILPRVLIRIIVDYCRQQYILSLAGCLDRRGGLNELYLFNPHATPATPTPTRASEPVNKKRIMANLRPTQTGNTHDLVPPHQQRGVWSRISKPHRLLVSIKDCVMPPLICHGYCTNNNNEKKVEQPNSEEMDNQPSSYQVNDATILMIQSTARTFVAFPLQYDDNDGRDLWSQNQCLPQSSSSNDSIPYRLPSNLQHCRNVYIPSTRLIHVIGGTLDPSNRYDVIPIHEIWNGLQWLTDKDGGSPSLSLLKRLDPSVIAYGDSMIVVCGGTIPSVKQQHSLWSNESQYISSCEAYNMKTKKWCMLPNLVTARHSAHTVIVNNCIMILVINTVLHHPSSLSNDINEIFC
jgi:hypothetical protein